MLTCPGYTADVVASAVCWSRIAFISKPFTRDTLARKVHEVLAGGEVSSRLANGERPTSNVQHRTSKVGELGTGGASVGTSDCAAGTHWMLVFDFSVRCQFSQ